MCDEDHESELNSLRAELDEAQGENTDLRDDVERLTMQLHEAEAVISNLREAVKSALRGAQQLAYELGNA